MHLIVFQYMHILINLSHDRPTETVLLMLPEPNATGSVITSASDRLRSRANNCSR